MLDKQFDLVPLFRIFRPGNHKTYTHVVHGL